MSWLFNYYETLEYNDEQFYIVNTYHNLTLGDDIQQKHNHYFTNTPVVCIGVRFGRKLIESKKWNINIECLVNYSTPLGYKTLMREYYLLMPE